MSFHERRPVDGNHSHIFLSTVLFTGFVGLGFWGFLSMLDTGDIRWGALPLTSIFSAAWLWWRMVEHDRRAFVERQDTRPKAHLVPAEEKPVSFHVFSKPSFNGKLTAVGKFSFSRGQWEALKQTIEDCDGKLLRDPIREAKVFPIAEVKKNWAGIVGEFKRLNLIDDDQTLTDFGRQFFFQYDPFARDANPPHPTGR